MLRNIPLPLEITWLKLRGFSIDTIWAFTLTFPLVDQLIS